MIDNTIEQFNEGFPIMQGVLDNFSDVHNNMHHAYQTIVSVMYFVIITQIDILVACKYFLMADKIYERQFMRGKLMVILNEGFKRLYGFDKKTYEKSEWNKLLPLMATSWETCILAFIIIW